ncbi:hypothetical protein [Entomospira culicis]|uniref:Uncharacterized protein n=1 Tax=Entomospira culicis TaxID=2719989 RepID=A0A968GF91_9SPIO|nr:hypothetical protein [Entomospira culicis]NIZ19209.1 hypothetical protein [Entomospira culicis]NIZ69423.1 hypothetical protein [Entomospira culicis]WDI36539.1 hypothetical protein PVA46_04245 [Entomospira culicis]WDI38165.1 hypothetical protein PVA47_04245 [Entomospira culicis]
MYRVNLRRLIGLGVMLVLCVGAVFAQEDEIEWEIKNVIHRQGYIGHEQTAIAMAKVLMEANYGKNFVVESSLTAKQERRSMDAIWRVYGILTSEADDEEPQVRLLVVLDRYTGGVRGVTNFTKKQNPYTPFLLKSSKKGHINDKKVATTLAEVILRSLYADRLTSQLPLKVRHKQGIWYINGTPAKGSDEPMVLLKMSRKDGSILAFDLA